MRNIQFYESHLLRGTNYGLPTPKECEKLSASCVDIRKSLQKRVVKKSCIGEVLPSDIYKKLFRRVEVHTQLVAHHTSSYELVPSEFGVHLRGASFGTRLNGEHRPIIVLVMAQVR